MARLAITIGAQRFEAELLPDVAPATCASLPNILPLQAPCVHVRWSGEAVWVPLGTKDLGGLGYENATSYPAPGQLLLYAGDLSEVEILVPYGPTHFASKAGTLAGNHFATIASGLDRLAEAGRAVLWQGAAEARFELI